MVLHRWGPFLVVGAALIGVGAGCATPAQTGPSPASDHMATAVEPSPTVSGVDLGPPSTAAATVTPEPAVSDWREGRGVPGFDVSRYQEDVDWTGLVAAGHRFVYVKATEGNVLVSPTGAEQARDGREVGLKVGGYHYARPNQSTGELQARFFAGNGGLWTPDGITMPGALDLEFDDSGVDPCYGLSPTEMVAWVRGFSDEYQRLAGRPPVIYTKAEVWDRCTAGDTSFADHPLWLFDHADVPGDLPAGWDRPTLWQRGVVDDLDRNVFLGTPQELDAWVSPALR